MKKTFKLLSFATALGIVLTLGGCGANTDEIALKEPTYETGTICSKDAPLTVTEGDLTLTLDPKTCAFTVTDGKTGSVWSSNPASDYQDAIATGVTKTNIHSQIAVNYVDSTNSIKPTNSRVGSVMKKSYEIYKIAGGFRVDYTFSQGFKIPVSYRLADGNLEASILYSGITETEDAKISTIELLPFFGSVYKDKSGFLLVPDGSGAVINFNNGKTNCSVYEKKVYGIDESLPNDIVTSRSEKVYVAAIGLKREDGAFVARAVSGEADSYVTAAPSGVATELNSIGFKAVYRSAENLSVMNGSLGTAGLVMYAAQEPTDVDEFTVKYSFINHDNVTVGDMAKSLREQMQAEGSLVQKGDDAFLYTDIYGGVSKPASFAGVQYTATQKLTDFDEAKELISKLLSQEVGKITVGYKNYSKSYFDGKVETDLTPTGNLGGKSGLKELNEFAKEKSIDLYMYADFYSFKKTGNGFSKFSDITKELDLGAVKVYPKKLNTNIPDSTAAPCYLLKASAFGDAAKSLLASADKNNISGIYLGDISGNLAGDYSVGGVKRSGASQAASSAVKVLTDKKLMLASPNFYMWKYMDKAVDIPVSSSGEKLFDYDVPLLQMLLKGNVSYAGYEMNLYNSDDDAFLSHIAAGQNVHYGFMAADASLLQNTELINAYGLSFEMADEAVKRAVAVKDLYSNIKDAFIDDYEFFDGVSKTTYSNGVVVIVNFNDTEITVSDNNIAARSYLLLRDTNALLKGGDSV